MLHQETFFLSSSFLLCISIGLLLLQVAVSQIQLGSKLSVVENEFWLSSNGDFAFRFFNNSDQPNQFSVGIYFNSNSIRIDQQTVVWVAGADVTIGINSYFQLTQKEELVLFDYSKGIIVWITKTNQLSIASAVLRDDGSLVLLNHKEDLVSQSFDTPSDTLLPRQKLTAFKTLRAASSSHVSSYYSLYMNDDTGQLQLKWESSVNYWKSGSLSRSNLSAVFTSNGTLQLLDQNLKPVWSVFGEDHNDDSINFWFLRLDVDGNLRLYSWLEVSKSWRSIWQASAMSLQLVVSVAFVYSTHLVPPTAIARLL